MKDTREPRADLNGNAAPQEVTSITDLQSMLARFWEAHSRQFRGEFSISSLPLSPRGKWLTERDGRATTKAGVCTAVVFGRVFGRVFFPRNRSSPAPALCALSRGDEEREKGGRRRMMVPTRDRWFYPASHCTPLHPPKDPSFFFFGASLLRILHPPTHLLGPRPLSCSLLDPPIPSSQSVSHLQEKKGGRPRK